MNTDGNEIHLSVIIPAHNEETRLRESLQKIFAFLDQQAFSSEVLVVENGSSDRTLEIAREAAEEQDKLRVFQELRRGKGLAVRRGMLEARGAYRFFCDADLSMPIDEVVKFLPSPERPDVEVAIASREAPGSVVHNRRAHRGLTGKAFNLIVRLLLLPGLRDTQCGFKCFRADVAECIFSRQVINSMAFDVELLYIARRKGYRILEIPITLYLDTDSRVRLFRDSARMAMDLLAIRRNWRRGVYD